MDHVLAAVIRRIGRSRRHSSGRAASQTGSPWRGWRRQSSCRCARRGCRRSCARLPAAPRSPCWRSPHATQSQHLDLARVNPAGQSRRPSARWPAARSTALTASPSRRPATTSARNSCRRLCGRAPAGAAAARSSRDRRRPRPGSARWGDRVAGQPAGIARAVEPLMVLRRRCAERGEHWREGEHALAQIGMEAHPLDLRLGEASALVPDRVGDAQAAEFVHAARRGGSARRRVSARPRDHARGRRRGPRRPRECPIVYGDLMSMKSPIASRMSSNSPSESSALQAGLGGNHRVPVGPLVEVGTSSLGACSQKRVHQRRIELRATALLGDLDRGSTPPLR